MEMQADQTAAIRKKILTHSVIFLAGIGVVFISLGASASFLGQWLQRLFIGQTATLIQQLAGIFIVFMGAGGLTIPVLMKEKRLHVAKKTTISYF